jgi:hypothetical protein
MKRAGQNTWRIQMVKPEPKVINVEKPETKNINISNLDPTPKSNEPKIITVGKPKQEPIIIVKNEEHQQKTITEEKNIDKEENPEEPYDMHYEAFQRNSITQEQFTEETTFKNGFIPNPSKKKQFDRWQHLQLRKECHENMDEIEAKEKQWREPVELMNEEIEKLQNNLIDDNMKNVNKVIE